MKRFINLIGNLVFEVLTLPKYKSILTLARYEYGETWKPPYVGADGEVEALMCQRFNWIAYEYGYDY